jgi:hypothetical protein
MLPFEAFMSDQFTSQYEDLLEGHYDCVDRLVVNAWLPGCGNGGGFRNWWRSLYGSDEKLDDEHLMRMAGRFSRRLRAWAEANGVPVVDCGRGERKHLTAEEFLADHTPKPGLFLVLVGRAPGVVWHVQKTSAGKIGNIARKEPWPYVNHYYFHIMDPGWGHITIRMCGHPPFHAQIILNGHEYVACQARAVKTEPIEFVKEGNCFVHTSNPEGLQKVADALRSDDATGLLKQICESWIYTACLCFALDMDEQNRSGFRYEYSSFQLEYSRNLQFHVGGQMEQVFQSLIDRTRASLDLDKVKTILGYQRRPWKKKFREGRHEITVEKPEYGLTVFKVHYGHLTLKIYTKGERVLRIEAIVHNTKELPGCRPLERFPRVVEQLRRMVDRFLEALHCMDACYIADDTLDQLPNPGQVGKTKVGGIDCNKLRMRTVMHAVVALSTSPKGFTASDLARKVCALNSPSATPYTARQAAYDLKKLRGKDLVSKTGNSRRYQPTPKGLRAMAAMAVLRDKVIKPLLAASGHPSFHPETQDPTRIDEHYDNLRSGMRGLFGALGIAA